MSKHVWVDGPDGPKYHCSVCEISKCDDWAMYPTCEDWQGRSEAKEMKEQQEALALWLEWFEKYGNPVYEDHCSYEVCFFCDEARYDKEQPHKPDCIYVRAKALVEKVSNP